MRPTPVTFARPESYSWIFSVDISQATSETDGSVDHSIQNPTPIKQATLSDTAGPEPYPPPVLWGLDCVPQPSASISPAQPPRDVAPSASNWKPKLIHTIDQLFKNQSGLVWPQKYDPMDTKYDPGHWLAGDGVWRRWTSFSHFATDLLSQLGLLLTWVSCGFPLSKLVGRQSLTTSHGGCEGHHRVLGCHDVLCPFLTISVVSYCHTSPTSSHQNKARNSFCSGGGGVFTKSHMRNFNILKAKVNKCRNEQLCSKFTKTKHTPLNSVIPGCTPTLKKREDTDFLKFNGSYFKIV